MYQLYQIISRISGSSFPNLDDIQIDINDVA